MSLLHLMLTWPNKLFQRTRSTKRLGVFRFCGVMRGAERGRYALTSQPSVFDVTCLLSSRLYN